MQLIMVRRASKGNNRDRSAYGEICVYIIGFYNIQDAAEADTTMRAGAWDGFTELIGAAVNNLILKNAVGAKLNKEGIISSLIIGGFDGICLMIPSC